MEIFVRKANASETKYFSKEKLWECGISQFDYQYDDDETCVIIEGEAEITCNKGKVYLKPDCLAYFPKGTKCVWNVIKPVKKYYR